MVIPNHPTYLEEVSRSHQKHGKRHHHHNHHHHGKSKERSNNRSDKHHHATDKSGKTKIEVQQLVDEIDNNMPEEEDEETVFRNQRQIINSAGHGQYPTRQQ